MMRTSKLSVVLAVLALLAATLGCRLPARLGAPAQTPRPTVAPAPTALPPLDDSVSALEERVMAIYDSVGPSVVSIISRFFVEDLMMQPIPQEGSGSGFLYDEDGHILTNFHVIENADELIVSLPDGRIFPARIVGVDPSNDLAVIRIEGENLPPPIPIGNTDSLGAGQFVLAIGSPFGQRGTLTMGIISAVGRVIQSPDGRFIGEAIQTDAAINPGNSGGPLLDLQGRVIGVNSQIISPSRASAGIGFSVPANTLRRVTPYLIAQGRYPHPTLGVRTLDLTPPRAAILRQAGVELALNFGLLVVEVELGGPADRAGIRGGSVFVRLGQSYLPTGGDVIIGLDGRPVANLQQLTVYLETEKQVGDVVEVVFVREGEEQRVEATLGERSM
jgi:S1-C subfamily serine protease